MGIKTVISNCANSQAPRSPRLAKALTALTITAVCSAAAQAEIRYEDRETRFSLDVRDETIANVMDSLSERFDFKVDGYPEHWSDDPINFSATGDLERVLRSLLKDTSHVVEYHTNPETRETHIAALKLLNEGVANPMANANSPANPSATGETKDNGRLGHLDDRATNTDRDFATGAGNNGAGNSAAGNAASAASAASNSRGAAPTSNLSSSLAARARQSTGTAAASTGSKTASSTAAPIPGQPSAEMQALTQKALQDVKGLADALRQAEGK